MRKVMDEMPKDVQVVFEGMMSLGLRLLELDPGNAWFWLTEVQRRLLISQIESVIEKKAG